MFKYFRDVPSRAPLGSCAALAPASLFQSRNFQIPISRISNHLPNRAGPFLGAVLFATARPSAQRRGMGSPVSAAGPLCGREREIAGERAAFGFRHFR